MFWWLIKAISNGISQVKGILQWWWESKWLHMAQYWSSPVLKRLEILTYIECLEQYLVANKVEDADQHRAMLMSVCSPATYRFGIPQEADWAKILFFPFFIIFKIFMGHGGPWTKHDDPKPSVIVQRYRFNTRNCRTGEFISTYVAELRHLSERYNFGGSLNKMLCDRIVRYVLVLWVTLLKNTFIS